MRRDMDRHCITVCPMKLVNCPFYPVGCQSAVPQFSLHKHRSERLQFHLLCILKPLHKEAPVKYLEKRAEELEKLSFPGRLTAARDARSLTYAIKDLEAKLGPVIVIAVGNEDGMVSDKKLEKEGLSAQIEQPLEVPDKKEEHLDPFTKYVEASDSSPGKGSPSSSDEEENNKSIEDHLEFNESTPLKEEESESTMEKTVPHNPAVKEENTELVLEKEEPSGLPNKGEAIKDLEAKLDPVEVINIGTEDGKVNDKKPEKEGLPPQIEEPIEMPGKNERHLNPSMEYMESSDSSPGKGSPSSSDEEENIKSIEEHIEFNESTPKKEDKSESTTERAVPHNLGTKVEYTESTLEKEEPSGSPNHGEAIKNLEAKLVPVDVIQVCSEDGKVNDKKPENEGLSAQIEEPIEMSDKKEAHLNPSTTYMESSDSSPGKGSPSSSDEEENIKSIEEHLEFNESTTKKEEAESTMERAVVP